MDSKAVKTFYGILGGLISLLTLVLWSDPFSGVVEEMMFYGASVLLIGCVSLLFLMIVSESQSRWSKVTMVGVALFDIVVGLMMVARIEGVADNIPTTLTVWILVHGIFGIVQYLSLRKTKYSLWLILSSIITSIVAGIILINPTIRSVNVLYELQFVALSLTYLLEGLLFA